MPLWHSTGACIKPWSAASCCRVTIARRAAWPWRPPRWPWPAGWGLTCVWPPCRARLKWKTRRRSPFASCWARLLFEVAPENADAFEAALAGLPVAAIGEVRNDDRIQIIGLAGLPVVETTVAAATHAWRGHLTS